MIQEVFDALRVGEFAQLSIANIDGDREMCDEDKAELIPHINLGLAALYKRFKLKEGIATLILKENKYEYMLTPQYATNDPLLDSEAYLVENLQCAYLDALVKVEEISTLEGKPLVLNQRGDNRSLFTPSATHLKVPKTIMSDAFSCPPLKYLEIRYRARHKPLNAYEAACGSMGYELELPMEYMYALCCFVASRKFMPVGMTQEHHTGNSYYAKYEAECNRLMYENMDQDVDNGDCKMDDKGMP